MIQQIKSIPTTYKGINFRSRLEATWASFFDEIKWQWIYEPFEFSGWIPDFLIYGEKTDVLIEVKPITRFEDFNDKIVWDTEKYFTVLVGLQPFIRNRKFVFGWNLIAQKEADEIYFKNCYKDGYAISSEYMSWDNLIVEKNEYRKQFMYDNQDSQHLIDVFNICKNQFQWHK